MRQSPLLALVYGPPAYRVSTSGDERAAVGVFWKQGTMHVAAVSGVEWSQDASRTESMLVERVEAWSKKSGLWHTLAFAGGSGSANAYLCQQWTEWRCEVAPGRVRITMGGVQDAVEFSVLDQGVWGTS